LLRPVRPLRFARLLFLPFDPLTISGHDWRSGDAAFPRSILAPLTRLVRAGLGEQARVIDHFISGHNLDSIQAIMNAGENLWPRAAEILGAADAPADWEDTGLSPTDWPLLAGTAAAVLRRAPALRRLARDEDLGVSEPNPDDAASVMRGLASEPALARAMIARLMMLWSPRMAAAMRGDVGAAQSPDDQSTFRTALKLGSEAVLDQIESEPGFEAAVADGSLAHTTSTLWRMTTLLAGIEADAAAAVQWPRLPAIRTRLNMLFHNRFARGALEGLILPLTAADSPIDAGRQIELETCARELRKLDIIAREVGGLPGFPGLLRQAAEAADIAAETETLTAVRHCRLIEILIGADAAEKSYNGSAASPA
jgi:hypothetical protein